MPRRVPFCPLPLRRGRLSAAVAALAAFALLACGALQLRHEAERAHARDPLTGELIHVVAAATPHPAGDGSCIHRGADDDSDGSPCALGDFAHELGVLAQPASAVAASRASGFVALATPPGRPIPRASVLASAPKTSPPRALA